MNDKCLLWSVRELFLSVFIIMAPIVLGGSFAGVPASIAIDACVSTSSVSLTFLRINNIPQTVRVEDGVGDSSSFGPVMVPTPSGWFQSAMLFNACRVRNSDVLLRGDWIELVSPSLTSKGVFDPVSSDIDGFPDGHFWIPSPSIVSRQSFSFSFCSYKFIINVFWWIRRWTSYL